MKVTEFSLIHQADGAKQWAIQSVCCGHFPDTLAHLQGSPRLDIGHAQVIEALGTGVQPLDLRRIPPIMVVAESQLTCTTIPLHIVE